MGKYKWFAVALFVVLILSPVAFAHDDEDDDDDDDLPKVTPNLKGAKIPAKTDDEVVSREEQALSSDGYSVEEQRLIREQAEKFTFQAEVSRLMHIIINSLYSNKEIFLRELISNGSDALDKIRFTALTNPSLLGEGDQAKLEIRIKIDKENHTIQITDTGIGMTKEELVKNLGTIAQSGTREFLQKFAEQGDKSTSNLIGQFGVGFYSVFLVADTVSVTSKSNDDDQHVWTSTADGSFTVSKDPQGNTLGRGTRITIHLKEDSLEYLEEDKIKTIAKRYSEFINFPIYLWTSRTVDKDVPIDDEEESEEAPPKEQTPEADVDIEVEEEEEEEDHGHAPKTKKVSETTWDWELLNQTKPIWTRSPKDLNRDDYHNFYRSITKDYEDPLKYIHFTAEGDVEFKSILYIPGQAPSNMFDPSANAHKGAIKLFVRRVFITDDFDKLVPNYLKFVRGVVDSDDLPLNVSREMLQQSKILQQIEKKLVRKTIAMFQELATGEDKDIYRRFWENYGTNVKLGVIEDSGNRSRLSKLLMFHSSKTGEFTNLDDYVSRMKEGQDQIFYLAGSNKDTVQKSPLIERAVKKGYEVLYMTDPIDEYALHHLTKYDGKYPMTNLGKEGVKFDDEEEDAAEEKKRIEEEFEPLTDFFKTTFSEQIEKVLVSDRLTTSPCALVSTTYGYTANMERIIKAQALGQNKQSVTQSAKKILEINPRHPIIKELLRLVQAEDGDKEAAKVTSSVLFETALMSSGYTVEDPASFAKTIHKMMSLNLNLGEAEVVEEAEPEHVPTPKQEEKEEKEEL